MPTRYPRCLIAHINEKHKNYKKVTCDSCEEGFVSRRDRDKHIANRHGIVGTPLGKSQNS